MKPDRTRSLRKSLCLVACFTIFISFASRSQCSTQQSITYDTLITGTGNDAHVFTLSQFDPSIGTLLSAKINSTISLNYGFTLKNVEAVQRYFSVSVGRYDSYTSTALSTPHHQAQHKHTKYSFKHSTKLSTKHSAKHSTEHSMNHSIKHI